VPERRFPRSSCPKPGNTSSTRCASGGARNVAARLPPLLLPHPLGGAPPPPPSSSPTLPIGAPAPPGSPRRGSGPPAGGSPPGRGGGPPSPRGPGPGPGLRRAPAIFAARYRRSPATMAYRPSPRGRTRRGWRTPFSRMDWARASRFSKRLRGWGEGRRASRGSAFPPACTGFLSISSRAESALARKGSMGLGLRLTGTPPCAARP
jgi:hypothetical protein